MDCMYFSDSKHPAVFSKSARPSGQMENTALGFSEVLGLASVTWIYSIPSAMAFSFDVTEEETYMASFHHFGDGYNNFFLKKYFL